MAAGVVELLFQCVFVGSLSIKDTDKERRPYHKNCSCALHTLQYNICFSHRRLSAHKEAMPWPRLIRLSFQVPSPLFRPQSSNTKVHDRQTCRLNY
ncbi:hypothetical protein LIER_43683 [Lithospermum erythrorhizon]|uniref:Secreted protein n=1 Tax=Lithospermum erythrorhizon TaxID=34254 RepID=A0AAV3QNT8_LITER